MSHTKSAINKARKSASTFKSKNSRATGDQRKTPANRFNDKELKCPWYQVVTATFDETTCRYTFKCQCGHSTLYKLVPPFELIDGYANHTDTHPTRE